MAQRSSGGRGRRGSWLTACFFPSSSGRERGEALGAEECMCVCVVTADYQRQENTEINLRAGERVEVIEKSESGWWFIRTTEEQGWVPATYLVSLTGHRDSHRISNGETERYVTVQSYISSSLDELGFESGVIVEVIQRNLEGWWFIRYGGKEGWAPAAYLRKIQDGVMPGNQATETNKPAVEGQVEIIGNLMEISNLLNKKHTQMDTNAHHNSNASLHSSHNTYMHSKTDSYTQYNGDVKQTDAYNNNTHTNNDNSTSLSTAANTGSSNPVTSSERDINEQVSSSYNPHTDTSVCVSVLDTSVSVSVSNAGVSFSETSVCSATSSAIKRKTVPPSPAIARVAPQRYHSVENRSPSNSQKPPPRRENSLGFQLPQPPHPPSVEAEYYTIAEFHSCLTDGISFSGGQKADVIEKNSGGWWYVQIGDKEGWAPCSYIDKRKKPSLNRQTSTLTRPKVPPPAPPIKKQNSLPCVESEVLAPSSPRVYEEPEYDVPAIGFEFAPELDFFPGDAPTKSPPPLSHRTVSFTLEEEDGEEDESVYANGGFIYVPKVLGKSHSDIHSPSGGHRSSTMWDPPEYDAPTIEPSNEICTQLYAHSKVNQQQPKLKQHADESKSKPSVRPKPANQDCNSLRRPRKSANQEQPGQIKYRTSRTSEESESAVVSLEVSMGSIDLSKEHSSFLYCTTAAYQREESCELSFPAGVQVEVLEKTESGWWFIRWENEEGWAPTFYLQPIKSLDTGGIEAKTTERIHSETSCPELEIALQVNVGKLGKIISLEKNEQRVNQSLKSTHRSNQQNCKVGVKQVAVRPHNVLTTTHTKDNTNSLSTSMHTTPSGQRNDILPSRASLHSYNDQSTSSCAGNMKSMRRMVPVSMVKPKPHLIHNNLREEYVSIADYHGDAETMSFTAGTRLEVLERNPNGWWYCHVLDTAKTRKGWVPSNFLERRS
ncbi:SH3 and PX domain-containing protein 2A-like isoform X1 [Xyrauchen texanus]|uniref:SH3 and PX domain-containing protein 2A-like isoform X1 n=1 Tax=Xyrauchen texanus TaxID=154827 RepID=UPI002241E9D6|nr:SH3 and PX domain-containing protein 2A-like isoform X1 [Xyrauchen texanus]